MKKAFALLSLFLLATVGSLAAQEQAPAAVPMTQDELVELLKGKVATDRIAAEVMQRGVDFDLNPDIEKKLRKAHADDPLIEAVKNQGPVARAERAKAGGGPVFSPQEAQDYQTIRNELDPDRMIQLVNDFEMKYPNSQLLTWIYVFGANACRQKGEIERSVEYGEKSLALKPDNLLALLTVVPLLPQNQLLRGSEIDREKRLTQAENYAKKALELIDAIPQQPNETPEQFNQRKNTLRVDPHSALGMVHLQRSQMALEGVDLEEISKAVAEYQQAVTDAPQPDPRDYFRLGEAYSLQKKFDEAIQAFTRAGEFGQGTIIKTYADQKIEDLKKRKAAAQ
ncbi:MAG TPA: tetratricopeptide repeat protein [Terriglobia bacterium]|nr:tetratricopeptide repeat protein [Terriglobia bacterium]